MKSPFRNPVVRIRRLAAKFDRANRRRRLLPKRKQFEAEFELLPESPKKQGIAELVKAYPPKSEEAYDLLLRMTLTAHALSIVSDFQGKVNALFNGQERR